MGANSRLGAYSNKYGTLCLPFNEKMIFKVFLFKHRMQSASLWGFDSNIFTLNIIIEKQVKVDSVFLQV